VARRFALAVYFRSNYLRSRTRSKPPESSAKTVVATLASISGAPLGTVVLAKATPVTVMLKINKTNVFFFNVNPPEAPASAIHTPSQSKCLNALTD